MNNPIKNLKVTHVRYFETRRGLGYECRTNNKQVSIWNDGNGGATYLDGNEHTTDYQMVNELKKWSTDTMLERLIDKFENVNQ